MAALAEKERDSGGWAGGQERMQILQHQKGLASVHEVAVQLHTGDLMTSP